MKKRKIMKKSFTIKICAALMVLIIGLIGFSYSYKAEMQTINSSKIPAKILDATGEIAGYKSWTKVNEKPELVESKLAMLCARPTFEQIDADAKNPHNDKFITVYINDIGKDEMMTKKVPKFPVGTVIVKEKLTTAESKAAELLTVMIKRKKDYNPKVSDWEFLTFNGAGTETTARGKLENCQTCHLAEKSTDYVSRRYLPYEVRQKLK
jgi:Cytochrome P460